MRPITALSALLSTRPTERSTSLGRGIERVRRILLSIVASAPARALQVLTLIVSTPLTLNYLGPARFGLWVTISSLLTVVQSADLGVGNALINATATAYGRGDRASACRDVSNSLAVLATLSLIAGSLLVVAYPWVSWNTLFNLGPNAAGEVGPAVATALFIILFRLPCSLVEKIRIGYQEGYINSAWESASCVLGLALLVILIYQEATLPWLLVALAAPPLLGNFGNWSLLLFRDRPWLQPRRELLSRSRARRLLGVGIMFFAMNVSGVITFSSDNFIAMRAVGADATAVYALCSKLFSACHLLTSLLLFPFWSAYGEAIAQSDIRWVKQSLTRSLVFITGLNFIAVAFIMSSYDLLIRYWTGRTIEVPFALMLGLAAHVLTQSCGSAVSFFLNGAGIMRFQVIVSVICAVVSLLAKVYFAHIFGVSGIIWGTVTVYAITILVPYTIFLPRYLQGMRSGTTDSLRE